MATGAFTPLHYHSVVPNAKLRNPQRTFQANTSLERLAPTAEIDLAAEFKLNSGGHDTLSMEWRREKRVNCPWRRLVASSEPCEFRHRFRAIRLQLYAPWISGFLGAKAGTLQSGLNMQTGCKWNGGKELPAATDPSMALSNRQSETYFPSDEEAGRGEREALIPTGDQPLGQG